MLVLPNRLTNALPLLNANMPILHPIEKKTVDNEVWVRCIEPSTVLSTYESNVYSGELGEWVTHSIEVNPEIDCVVFDYRDDKQSTICRAGVWTRARFVLPGSHASSSWSYAVSIRTVGIAGKWVRLRNQISVDGQRAPDIWMPPDHLLTDGQRPPYGEYTELKAF